VQLREEIRRIQLELGITTIYVTHDQEEALSISDRVAVLYRGKIEQIGTPADMYGTPDTPFVAEFIGTMNRLHSTVTDAGWVAHEGTRLRVDAAEGRPQGERVLLLVRPETVELTPANGDGLPEENTLAGTVLTHTFLGASTRIRVETGGSEITADIPTGRIGDIPIGTRVHARFPAESARLLTLGDDADEIVAAAAAEES
jgi:putative spermidine/putrescine transport system ATP-binding protein